MTPYRALYGQPPTVSSYLPGLTEVHTIGVRLRDHDKLLDLLKLNLHLAQNRMCQQANEHCTYREYAPGDSVFLKLQPYRQHSVALQQIVLEILWTISDPRTN